MSGQASMDVATASRRAGSLRARLLWFLLAAIVLAGAVQALVTYRTVLREADEIFDYHMQQMAMSLRSGLPPGSCSRAQRSPLHRPSPPLWPIPSPPSPASTRLPPG